MKITFISDAHGNLNFKIQPCELLIMAGDMCPSTHNGMESIILQENWLRTRFKTWLSKQPFNECIFVAGNHDWIFDLAPELVPKIHPNFNYLCDESIDILGLKVYGTPQQKKFNKWAFNRTSRQLKMYYSNIPENLDILISHSPVHNIFDYVINRNRRIGCTILEKKLNELRLPPKIFVSGHNHDDYGIMKINKTTYINCSLLNDKYEMVKKPITFNYKE